MIAGTLHIYVAFDWGEEIDLERASQLVPASVHALPRRRRTPPSFFFRPSPLHIVLEASLLTLTELGTMELTPGVTIFDFAAVSLSWHVPFQLSPEGLRKLAQALAESQPVIQAARAALEPLYQQLAPSILNPAWGDDLSEEYFVFQLPPGGPLAEVQKLLPEAPGPADSWGRQGLAAWLAGLVHLESEPLSSEEMTEALRVRLGYGPDDLFVPDWAAAVLVDRDCNETLQAIEFANLQLLEYRHIDHRLDASLAAAYRLIHPLVRTWLPFWRSHSRPLRSLGELKVEASDLFERTGNALKLVGDPYLARVYRLVAGRFHLETWQESIQRKLEAAEGVFQMLSDQASALRMEFLEATIVFLIIFEILMAFWR